MPQNIAVVIWSSVSALGSEYVFMAIIPAIYWFIGKRHARDVFYAFALSAICGIWLKNIFRIPRPPKEQWLVPAEGYGFPSGHTMVTTAFWSALYLSLKKHLLGRSINIALLLAFLMPVIVGISRIALGVHSIADVIGGFIFGLIIAFVTVTAFKYVLPIAQEFDGWQRISYPLGLSLFMFSATALYMGVDYIQLYHISKICGAFFGFTVGYMRSHIEKLPVTEKTDIIKYYILGLFFAIVIYMVPMPVEFLFNNPNYNLVSYYIRSALFAIAVTYWYPNLILRGYNTSGKDWG